MLQITPILNAIKNDVNKTLSADFLNGISAGGEEKLEESEEFRF